MYGEEKQRGVIAGKAGPGGGELMAQKPAEKISIQDIATLCGMRRQNFYYHFEDIYDLLRWMFYEEAVSLLQKQEGTPLWQEGILLLSILGGKQGRVPVCAELSGAG